MVSPTAKIDTASRISTRKDPRLFLRYFKIEDLDIAGLGKCENGKNTAVFTVKFNFRFIDFPVGSKHNGKTVRCYGDSLGNGGDPPQPSRNKAKKNFRPCR